MKTELNFCLLKTSIFRRRFIGDVGVIAGAMTILPLLNLSAVETHGPWISLFNGKDLAGWKGVNGTMTNWKIKNGLLVSTGRWEGNATWIAHEQVFADFELEVEFRYDPGCNSGVFFRTPLVEKSPAYLGNEIQIADMTDEKLLEKITSDRYMGALYNVASPTGDATKKPGEWQGMNVRCVGERFRVTVNDLLVQDFDLTQFPEDVKKAHPGLLRSDGHIGLQNKDVRIEFRKVRIREIQ
ncbi:MAG: DUF1080 domain-containing protein [Verrucomicrobia bacterium]|nr:DUF1080 domain-containing protein [Verrucomicrobiota bacterium]MDA1068879.1 DUF1080 domain-containing protein [Verrucomicrobiota bacterium]